MRPSREAFRAYQPPSKSMATEPFQIFSLQYRKKLPEENPGLPNSRIMSLLGKMWQVLPQDEKLPYQELARSVATDWKRRRKRSPKPRASALPPSDQTPGSLLGKAPLNIGPCPVFAIIPRGEFGVLAAIASQQTMAHDESHPAQSGIWQDG
jgi:hypothetical protein